MLNLYNCKFGQKTSLSNAKTTANSRKNTWLSDVQKLYNCNFQAENFSATWQESIIAVEYQIKFQQVD